MKKITLVLVVLLAAAPAMALTDVTITATPDGTTGDVDLVVTWSGGGSPPRAFAIDVNVTSDVNIIDVSGYHTGESNQPPGNKGFGIFPASFNRHIDADDPNWADVNYTPVADACDLPGDTLGGIGTSGVTLELGSLYTGPNVPTSPSTLATITVDGSCTVCMKANIGRGKIVLEDGNEPDSLTANCVEVTVAPVGFTIFGQVASRAAVGEDGVTMSGLPGAPVTSGGGYYSDTVPAGWNGTVTPAKSGKGFVPKDLVYANVQANQANHDYLVGDGSCLRADICSTTYGAPDGLVTGEDYDWLMAYYPKLPATVFDCAGDASCLRADLCSTTYGAPDGLITGEDYDWLMAYYPKLPATQEECCP